MKFKKRYWIYILLLLILIFFVWLFGRSAMADTCSLDLNTCLLKGKIQSFWPRMWNGTVCTVNNLGCLIRQLF